MQSSKHEIIEALPMIFPPLVQLASFHVNAPPRNEARIDRREDVGAA